eukprot:SAG31_NODE_2034_length_6611_cov_5.685964_1_plen_147_part_00
MWRPARARSVATRLGSSAPSQRMRCPGHTVYRTITGGLGGHYRTITARRDHVFFDRVPRTPHSVRPMCPPRRTSGQQPGCAGAQGQRRALSPGVCRAGAGAGAGRCIGRCGAITIGGVVGIYTQHCAVPHRSSSSRHLAAYIRMPY